MLKYIYVCVKIHHLYNYTYICRKNKTKHGFKTIYLFTLYQILEVKDGKMSLYSKLSRFVTLMSLYLYKIL